MSEWQIAYAPQAKEDWRIAKGCGQRLLAERIMFLIDVVRGNPYCSPPPFKKLNGELIGAFSRRINKKHRLVYQILEDHMTVKILACWGHYED